MTKQISRTTKRPGFTADVYLGYFRELTAEYAARRARLEQRLLAGATEKQVSLNDVNVEIPIWELEDVCCYTNITLTELQSVLVPLFDEVRRHDRVCRAILHARAVPRRDRLALAAKGLEHVLRGIPLVADGRDIEGRIDRWVAGMFGECTFSEHEHFGRTCQKPVSWTPADIGAGRSTDIDAEEKAA